MPTANRRRFVPQSIRYFLRQDYANKELIIVDDGTDAVADLIPDDERIVYIRLPERLTVGAKRNLACERARGQLIAHWDDDDWHAPHRLSYQVRALLRGHADVCGINTLLFYEAVSERAWRYSYPSNQKPWLSGSTLCYTRAFWKTNRFPDIDVGEDARFMWSNRAKRLKVLEDATFHVGLVHENNVSPKQTAGAYWQTFPVEQIRRLLGDDWRFYHPAQSAVDAMPVVDTAAAVVVNDTRPAETNDTHPLDNLIERSEARTVRNIYACLVHEKQECIVDLVRNLRYHDPSSAIILYNGGNDAELLKHNFPYAQYGATVHPNPHPMRWGWLHDFALDTMRFALDNFSFDTLTIVDSDQLALRSGYSQRLAELLAHQSDVGMLGNAPAVQPRGTRVAPAVQALKEIDLWRPFLRRFEDGERKFVHWTFWPSTVFTADAARDLLRLFADDTQFQDIMQRSQIWATEEIVFPTLVALLGYRITANPSSYDYVKYRVRYSLQQLNTAFTRRDAFWMHPVPREYDDRLRRHIRTRSNHYERRDAVVAAASLEATDEDAPALLLNAPIIAQMKKVEGWLDEAEADLLIAAASRALGSLPAPHALVEVGSFCGRATTVLASVARVVAPAARVYSIDPHDGRVGALDQRIDKHPPTLEKFKRNMQKAGLSALVEIIQKRSVEVAWERPISLLLIDGLHDYASVSQDFYHFERWIVPDGLVAFHDYAAYFPGVQAFVNELLRTGRYRKIHCVASMMVLRKLPTTESQTDRDMQQPLSSQTQVTHAHAPLRPTGIAL
ncbi:MAG TPA: glycosyltransferase [Pyrinomonadaceae bacterium]